jgi:hypothetical protein
MYRCIAESHADISPAQAAEYNGLSGYKSNTYVVIGWSLGSQLVINIHKAGQGQLDAPWIMTTAADLPSFGLSSRHLGPRIKAGRSQKLVHYGIAHGCLPRRRCITR